MWDTFAAAGSSSQRVMGYSASQAHLDSLNGRRQIHQHSSSRSSSSTIIATAPVNKPKHKGKALLAGGISGAIEICMTYPTEYVKTRQQLSTKSLTVGEIIADTKKPLGFYRGLNSMLYFAVPKAATRFGMFEIFSGLLNNPDGSDKYGLGQARGFLGGLGAGACEAIIVTTPQENIKIKLVNDMFRTDGTVPRYKGFFHGVSTIVKENGVGAIYHGMPPTVFKVATAQATRFGMFQLIPPQWRTTPVTSAAAGAFAGFVSVLIFQGVDVVKSRLQGLDQHKYSGSLDCVRKILSEEGVMGFYKGVGPRLTRVTAEVAITMSLYPEVVKMLDSVWHTDP